MLELTPDVLAHLGTVRRLLSHVPCENEQEARELVASADFLDGLIGVLVHEHRTDFLASQRDQ